MLGSEGVKMFSRSLLARRSVPGLLHNLNFFLGKCVLRGECDSRLLLKSLLSLFTESDFLIVNALGVSDKKLPGKQETFPEWTNESSPRALVPLG